MLGSVLAAGPFLPLSLLAVRVGLTRPGTGCSISSGTEMVYTFSFCAVRFCTAFRLCGWGQWWWWGRGRAGGVVIAVRVVVVVVRGVGDNDCMYVRWWWWV